MTDIRNDIRILLANGVDMDEILVNESDDWGEECAISRADAEECAAQWNPPGDLDDLTPAQDWLADHDADD